MYFKVKLGKLYIALIGLLLFGGVLPSYASHIETFLLPDSARTDTNKVTKRMKVELIYADRALGDRIVRPDVNVFQGNVHFLHKGMHMFCDSILVYDNSNSIEAFNNVRVEQGDTLFIYGDYLYYDGVVELARLRDNVRLINRETQLTTDSLNYDRIADLGYYFNGGVLTDTENRLESDWGQYSPATKLAKFNKEVHLTNDKLELFSDTLKYSTWTKEATILGPSEIISQANTIHSSRGVYYTVQDQATLLDRSVLYSDGKVLTGDSLFYDRLKGFGEAFDNIEMTDTINLNRLEGNYCYYDELTQNAFATNRAVAIDYSQGDSLFVHGDTLRLETYNLNTDSVYHNIKAYKKVRVYRSDIQASCDSLVFNSLDSCLTLYTEPVIWNENQQLLGEEIRIYMNDSTIDWVHIENQALAVEKIDTIHYNQVSGHEIKAYFKNGEMNKIDVVGNVIVGFYPIEKDGSMMGLVSAETSLMNIYIENMQLERVVMSPKSNGVLYPLSLIPEDKLYLEPFVWLDYMRPLNREDIFNWRAKRSEDVLKKSTPKRELPQIDRGKISRKRR